MEKTIQVRNFRYVHTKYTLTIIMILNAKPSYYILQFEKKKEKNKIFIARTKLNTKSRFKKKLNKQIINTSRSHIDEVEVIGQNNKKSIKLSIQRCEIKSNKENKVSIAFIVQKSMLNSQSWLYI